MSGTFYAPIVRVLVALVMLWFARVVLLRLPMIRELTIPDVPLTGLALVRIVISLLMIGVLLNFAREFGHQLTVAFPQLPQGSTILTSLVYIAVVVLAYDAFNWPARLFLKEDFWVYQWAFVLLAIPGIYKGGVAIYGSVDDIAALFTREIGRAAGELVPCPECGQLNPVGANFCFKCGTDIEVARPAAPIKCSQCGAENPAEATFCAQCGAKIEVVAEEAAQPAMPIKCANCGTESPTEAVFCAQCGAKLEAVAGKE